MTGDKSISALNAVGQTDPHQAFQHTVDRDRRDAPATGLEPLDYVVGAQRDVTGRELAQHAFAQIRSAARRPRGKLILPA